MIVFLAVEGRMGMGGVESVLFGFFFWGGGGEGVGGGGGVSVLDGLVWM